MQAEFIFVQSIIQHVLIWNGVTFSVISHKKFDMDIFDIVRKRLSVITQSVLSFYAILYKNKNASAPSNFAYLYLSIFRMCNTFFRFLFLLFYVFYLFLFETALLFILQWNISMILGSNLSNRKVYCYPVFIISNRKMVWYLPLYHF